MLWCTVHVYSLTVPLAGRGSRHGRVSFCTCAKTFASGCCRVLFLTFGSLPAHPISALVAEPSGSWHLGVPVTRLRRVHNKGLRPWMSRQRLRLRHLSRLLPSHQSLKRCRCLRRLKLNPGRKGIIVEDGSARKRSARRGLHDLLWMEHQHRRGKHADFRNR